MLYKILDNKVNNFFKFSDKPASFFCKAYRLEFYVNLVRGWQGLKFVVAMITLSALMLQILLMITYVYGMG